MGGFFGESRIRERSLQPLPFRALLRKCFQKFLQIFLYLLGKLSFELIGEQIRETKNIIAVFFDIRAFHKFAVIAVGGQVQIGFDLEQKHSHRPDIEQPRIIFHFVGVQYVQIIFDIQRGSKIGNIIADVDICNFFVINSLKSRFRCCGQFQRIREIRILRFIEAKDTLFFIRPLPQQIAALLKRYQRPW